MYDILNDAMYTPSAILIIILETKNVQSDFNTLFFNSN